MAKTRVRAAVAVIVRLTRISFSAWDEDSPGASYPACSACHATGGSGGARDRAGGRGCACDALRGAWAPAGQAGTTGERGDGGGIGRGGITCTGSSTSSYDPPLTLAPQPTHVHAIISYTCTTAPGHTVPATGSFDADLPSAPCLALSGGSGVETVRYADGGRSLIVYDSATTVRAAGVLALEQSGRVTEGRGKGHPARRTVTGPETGDERRPRANLHNEDGPVGAFAVTDGDNTG